MERNGGLRLRAASETPLVPYLLRHQCLRHHHVHRSRLRAPILPHNIFTFRRSNPFPNLCGCRHFPGLSGLGCMKASLAVLRHHAHRHHQPMPPFFDRFRAAVSRRSKRVSISLTPKESVWERLPDDVLVRIVALCEIDDIKSLALACRLLHRRIFEAEFAISRSYIKLRCRNTSFDNDCDISLSPGDDLSFITELFPPDPPLYALGECHHHAEYSLAYLADLIRCWSTCVRLSYHLADNVVRHHLETDSAARPIWSFSKTEKELVYSKAVEKLQGKLLHPMYGFGLLRV